MTRELAIRGLAEAEAWMLVRARVRARGDGGHDASEAAVLTLWIVLAIRRGRT